ncbi:Glycosyl transferase family 2 [Pseudarcicella hirudinis]|uniref:Glycosyl transferase family 2 n=1 Tax=Pseudarcicella hirudinis TaxID=1079859 RepID=A0A1I5MP58_9BACT|nr:glycosyltransferase [Pseudarcicella hirudinis]SFP11404.1 Glycosyl transferase family 2 [Pseudarcicella hirudinis]
MKKITVIIPALNEEEAIQSVIQKSYHHPDVDDVIVVDDNSVDNTVELAKEAGASVITSARKGKGISMREGLLMAKNELIVYLDADIKTYPKDIIERLVKPLKEGPFDFVKSYFERQAGRVTELVAKPLLSLLSPQLSHFQQPLSGIIAGKRTLLMQVDFENDYGVDIGLLVDMYNSGAKISEVNIGTVENKMKPWRELGKMAKEVSAAILKRTVLRENTRKVLREELV